MKWVLHEKQNKSGNAGGTNLWQVGMATKSREQAFFVYFSDPPNPPLFKQTLHLQPGLFDM